MVIKSAESSLFTRFVRYEVRYYVFKGKSAEMLDISRIGAILDGLIF